MKHAYFLPIGLGCWLITSAATAQTPTLTGLSPARNAVAAPRTAAVVASFDQPLSNTASTQQALKVFSQQAGGKKAGMTTVSGSTVTLTPTTAFKAGETVFATVTAPANPPQVFQFTTATAPSTGLFSGGADLAGGTGARRTAVGDVDGDGDLDLVTATTGTSESSNGTISIRLNNGGGNYGSSQQVLTGNVFSTVVLGDVDGDGDLDLLAANTNSGTTGTVSVRLNNGQGTFSGTQEVVVNGPPSDLRLGDVDADGDLDLVTVTGSSRNSSASVRLNNGNGIFGGTQEVVFGGSNVSVLLGDVDGDGDLDLLSGSTGSVVYLRLNNGNGSFSGVDQQAISVGGDYPSIALGDVDGDGDLDLVTANSGASPGQRVSVRPNNGSGSFGSGQDLALSTLPIGLALGDVDGDGDLDLATATPGNSSVSVRLNNGAGLFGSGQDVSVAMNQQATSLGSVTLGDVDNNGTLDLLAISNNGSSSTVSVRLNDHLVLATASGQRATQLSLYPNPAHGTVQLTLPATNGGTELQVELYNTLGQRVRRFSPANANPQPTTLDLRGLAPGPYLLRLTSKQQTATRTLVLE